MLGPESHSEKLVVVVQTALALKPMTTRNLVQKIMQPFALVAREVTVGMITSLGDLLFSHSKDTKDLLAESCRELDKHVNHLTAVVLEHLSSERVTCEQMTAALHETPGVIAWIST